MMYSSGMIPSRGTNILRPLFGRCRALASTSTAATDTSLSAKNIPSALQRFLVDKIKVSGPITVAEYMKTAVSSSAVGYYGQHSDDKALFGDRGDFITAPELTQLFGEIIGIWFYYELANTGHKGEWNLVECGPGTGQLAADVLRVLQKFGEKEVSLHLVESSTALIDAQEKSLCEQCTSNRSAPQGENLWVRANRTREGVPVYWYNNVDDLPNGFSVFVANEFLDALPVHVFEREGKAWHEKYIGLDGKNNLRFVRSKGENIHTRGLLPEIIREDDSYSAWECSPEAGTWVSQISDRISTHGGFALVVDYGHDGTRKEASFRAYSKHTIVDPLSAPGAIDLTADVNFGHLRSIVHDQVLVFGPQTQREFLAQLGVETRLRRLVKECAKKEDAQQLIDSYNMLMGEMGERFHAMALFPKTLQSIINRRGGFPSGFNGAPGPENVHDKEKNEQDSTSS